MTLFATLYQSCIVVSYFIYVMFHCSTDFAPGDRVEHAFMIKPSRGLFLGDAFIKVYLDKQLPYLLVDDLPASLKDWMGDSLAQSSGKEVGVDDLPAGSCTEVRLYAFLIEKDLTNLLMSS